MIRVNGIEISLEGDFQTLIKEIASVMHTIAKAASKQFEKELGDEVSYDNIIELILEELAQLKKFDSSDGTLEMPKKIFEDFYKQLREQRRKYSHQDNFIDYDTSRPDSNAASKIIRGAINDVFIDPRGEIDIEDLKAIKKNKKNKRDKKK